MKNPNVKISDEWMKTQFRRRVDRLAEVVRGFAWEDKAAYAAWLAQTYYLVRHTTTFLALKAAKYGPAELKNHLGVLHHLHEEIGHPQVALKDIEALGFKIEQFPELTETRLLWQNQYYWIEHEGPIAHTGYSLMLEGLAVVAGPEIAQRILTTHGKGAAGFLGLHAEADVKHLEMGNRELANATRSALERCYENLEQSCMLYEAIFERIRAQAGKLGKVTPLRKKAA